MISRVEFLVKGILSLILERAIHPFLTRLYTLSLLNLDAVIIYFIYFTKRN